MDKVILKIWIFRNDTIHNDYINIYQFKCYDKLAEKITEDLISLRFQDVYANLPKLKVLSDVEFARIGARNDTIKTCYENNFSIENYINDIYCDIRKLEATYYKNHMPKELQNIISQYETMS